jgi:hypothetical protein
MNYIKQRNKTRNNWVISRKAFFYSHIVSISILVYQDMHIPWGKFFAPSLFLGKCSVHFLGGNWNFTFSSFASMIEPVVFLKKSTTNYRTMILTIHVHDNNGLVEGIVLWVRTFSWVKPYNLWRAMTTLVHCSLLRGVAFGEDGFMVLSW